MAGKGGGGAWKVAYADFATAMMAFFLVMWITTQNKAVKESVAQYFENPLGTEKEARATSVHGIPGASADAEFEREQAGPHGSRTREQGTYAISDNLADPDLQQRPLLHIFNGLNQTRTFGTMVLFAGDSTDLTPDAQLQLSEVANEFRGKSHKIEIRGHAGRKRSTQTDGKSNSWELSYARAMNTMKFLISCDIEPNRFRLSQEGAFEPYSNQGNPLDDHRNSRVEVFAIDELTHEFKQTRERRAGDFVPVTKEMMQKSDAADHHEANPDGHHAKTDAGKSHGGHAAKSDAAKPADGHGAHGKASAKGHGGGH